MELRENCDFADTGGVAIGAAPLGAPRPRQAVIGVVIIGRNEGRRLGRCLEALPDRGMCVVYADSGSVDGSIESAADRGADVVRLDPSCPFTAARGRNEGFARLMELEPRVQFVQFVDGDVELDGRWLDSAAATLAGDDTIAAVCGRLREKHRDDSIYARLCDMEWNGPKGDIRSCGGISMMRASAFRDCGGFDAALAAGEEAELCGRLRQRGHRIVRIDAAMGDHDAGIETFAQWSRRARRAGRAYGKALFAAEKDAYKRKQAISALVWAGAMPMLAVLFALTSIRSRAAAIGVAAIVAAYGLIALRVYQSRRRQGDSAADARLYSVFCIISKWPQLLGQIQAWFGA